MDLSGAVERLSYDPRFSWVNNDPLVYFNKHTLARGEEFKVLVRYPRWWYGSPYLSISTEEAEEGQILTKELSPLGFSTPGKNYYPYYYGTVVNTTDELHVGSYVAQVLVPGPEPRISRVGAKHSFQIWEPGVYTERLQQMMGEAWDEPVYLDHLEREGAEDLLLSLPTDEFLSFLPESTPFNNRTLCHLLGPLATTFMQSAMGPLPFPVDYRVFVDEERLPHIDLLKTIWLLNAVAPAWADMMFFSGACIVWTTVIDRGMSLGIEAAFPDVGRRHSERQEQTEFPPLLRTVLSNIRDEMDCDIRWEPPGAAWIVVRE
jgi:hypothetical protein